MRLILTVKSYCNQPASEPKIQEYESFPVSIGRSEECEYSLDDAYISLLHAMIITDGNQLLIEDHSSNGVFMNDAVEPLGKGNGQVLANMDSLEIGDFNIQVGIEHANSVSSASEIEEYATGYMTESSEHNASTRARANDPFAGNAPDWHLERQVDGQMFSEVRKQHYKTVSAPSESELNPLADDTLQHWPDDPVDVDSMSVPVSASGIKMPDADIAPPFEHEPVPGNKLPVLQRKQKEPPEELSDSSLLSGQTDDAIQILLRAASLAPADFAHLHGDDVLEQTGHLLAQMVDAFMLLLQSRTEMKSAFRSDVTMLSSSGNNPLKFSANAQDALTKLLVDSSQAYQQSDIAIKDAADDLKEHQIAMLEGMQSAVNSILVNFNPDELVKDLEKKGGLAANIPLKREAKLWAMFCDRYNSTCDEVANDFYDVFGDEFRTAYEKCTRQTRPTPDS